MKAKSVGLNLFHLAPGHHTEVCMWHDRDHKPEVLGTMPDVYISERWVAPPEDIAARPASALAHNGGEYLNVSWSAAGPESIDPGFAVLRERLLPAGRMAPMQ